MHDVAVFPTADRVADYQRRRFPAGQRGHQSVLFDAEVVPDRCFERHFFNGRDPQILCRKDEFEVGPPVGRDFYNQFRGELIVAAATVYQVQGVPLISPGSDCQLEQVVPLGCRLQTERQLVFVDELCRGNRFVHPDDEFDL